MDHLRRYAVEQAQAKDYVREIQVRLLVRPLVERLRAELGSGSRIEEQCLLLLMHLRTEDDNSQGYGPAGAVSRRSPGIRTRCSPSPGVRMGACLPVVVGIT